MKDGVIYSAYREEGKKGGFDILRKNYNVVVGMCLNNGIFLLDPAINHQGEYRVDLGPVRSTASRTAFLHDGAACTTHVQRCSQYNGM